jgi:hypothetical protein
LEWECSDAAQRFCEEKIGNVLGRILNEVAMLEPTADSWPPDLKLITKRLLGEAMARVLRADGPEAEKALANAKKFIKEKSPQVSRYWTLQSCAVTGAVAILIGVLELIFEKAIVDKISETPYHLTLCFCAGCAGALLFVILGIGRQPNANSSAQRRLHYLEGICRIGAGGIAGVLVASAVKLQLFLPVFSKIGMERLAMCTAAMIAGASERLAAGIVTGVEAHSANKKDEDSNAAQ